jgi:hypothetical protein
MLHEVDNQLNNAGIDVQDKPNMIMHVEMTHEWRVTRD